MELVPDLDLENDIKGFQLLSNLLGKHAGVSMPLTPKNKTLMATRLKKALINNNCKNYGEFHSLCERNQEVLGLFISQMTTHTTHFFRENDHFKVLVEQIEKGNIHQASHGEQLRVWCAAASSGEEPYTMAITLLEQLDANKIKFLATDIDQLTLDKANRGEYDEKQVRLVPESSLKKFFTRLNNGQTFKVRNIVKNLVTFAPFNLMEKSYPFKNPFHVIFCRNVLIYFEQDKVAKIVNNLTLSLKPGGLLFVGHSETGSIKHPKLERVAHAVYKKVA